MNHIELGREGERIAANQLITKGYTIISRNYRLKNAEIDIVCTKDDKLIIVEVKTRNSTIFGEPYLSVTRSKQRQIIRVANNFIEEKDIDMEVRFDVISIILNNNTMRLEHIEDAFYPLV